MRYLTASLLLVLGVVSFAFLIKPYLHGLQLSGYKTSGIYKSKKFKPSICFQTGMVISFVIVWVLFYFVLNREIWGLILALGYLLTNLFSVVKVAKKKYKKPLKFTKRMIRLFLFAIAIYAAILGLGVGLMLGSGVETYFILLYALLTELMYAHIVAVSNVIALPFEKLNNRRYVLAAKNKLIKENPIKIAITGSYGKTSVKNYLAEMLKYKYKVLATKASFNTPLGMAMAIGELDCHDVFIAEFGARKTGDIAELMNMIKPDHAILTGITAQHLETFYSIENVIEEKHKVLNVDGIKVAADTDMIRKLDGVLYVGKNDGDFCKCDLIESSESGSRFIMHIDESTLVLKTALLGEHNVMNLMLAAAMAYKLGISLGEIEDAIIKMTPIPHRLELIRSGNINILDDTFNCNPQGAECALNVLKEFDGRKIVLTPGMVELGGAEKSENYLLGRKIAAVADRTVLIGANRTKPIYEGLLSGGFKESEIFVFDTLEKAKSNFSALLGGGDTLLMLNDLPDNY